MRREFIALATVVIASVLAACSSSVGVTPPQPGPLPTSVPVFHYSGRTVQKYTYAYGYPSPEPPATIVTRTKESVYAFAASGYPAGTLDVHSQAVDKTSLQTTQSVTDAFLNDTSSAQDVARQVLLYATTSTIEAAQGGQSTTIKTTYPTPQIVSQKSGTWTNSPGATIDESYSDGHYQDRTIAADGSYDEKGTTIGLNGNVAPITLREESSGAGAYTGPFVGCPPDTSFQFTAAPNIELKLVSKPPSAYCEMRTTRIIDWYPASPTLYTEHDTAKSSASIHVGCEGVSGKREHVTTRTVTSLDTIIGYVERTQMTMVNDASSGVLLCMVMDDRIDNYYNWQGDTLYFFYFTPNGKPISTIDTDEVLAISDNDVRNARVLGAATPDAIAAGAQAHFMMEIEHLHEQLRDAMIKRLVSKHLSLGGTR